MESLSVLLNKWRTASAAMQKLTNDTPRILGKESVDVVKENFTLQGYDSGYGVEKWEERKESTDKAYDRGKTVNSRGQQSRYRTGRNATFKGSVFSSQNPLLEQTRRLYSSIKYKVINKTVTIGVDLLLVPYAEKMNEGGNGTPSRKFTPAKAEPPNPKMLKRYKKKLEFERGKAMKDFVKYK